MDNLRESNTAERDTALIKRAEATLSGNIIPRLPGQPYAFSKLRGIQPSPGTYHGVWNWDAAFHMIGVSYFDPVLAREQAQILLENMLENGQLPDVIYTTGEKVTRFTKPPVLAWAVMRADKIAPDKEFLAYAYPKLIKNLDWWNIARFDGILYGYKVSRMECGWDNTVRFDFPHKISHCYAVDLNCFMADMYSSLSYMATGLDKPDEAKSHLAKRAELAANTERYLYSEKDGCYCDYDKVLKRSVRRFSPASFMPLFSGTASKERAERMAAAAENPKMFFPGMPTISYGNKKYNSGRYWRGPCWLNTAYFAIKGLSDYGYVNLALRYIEKILNWCEKNTDSIYEYYDSITGKGLGAKDFGWSAVFIMELIKLKSALK